MKKIFLILLVLTSLFILSCSRDEPSLVGPPPNPTGSDIVINELYSRGDLTNPDWVELYNKSNTAINIGGYKIYDAGGQSGSKPKLEIPAGTTIPAKGYFVIVVDDAATYPTSSFGLSSNGEDLWLENSSGRLIDYVTFPALNVDQSYARIPDGADTWNFLSPPTKNAANSSTPPPDTTVVINEVYSRGITSDPDWIELYNPKSTAIDISGYKIYDVGGQSGTKPKKEIPTGTTIPAKGYLVIVVDDGTASGFGLSSNGEQVWLENTSNTVIDDITFPALGVDSSYGRMPDGASTWQIISPATKGFKNDSTTTPITNLNVVMNEIWSRGTTGVDPDWIEVYNPNTIAVDITGYKIYDSGGQSGSKPKKEFPSGSIIPAKGFLVIITDDSDASGFGLSSSGEQVWLENANSEVIDNVNFPAMDVTQSYGRNPDGSTNWQLLNTITKGTSNNQ